MAKDGSSNGTRVSAPFLGTTDTTAVEFLVEDCAGQPRIEQMSESDDEIRVRIVAHVDGDPAECPATVRVQLEQPLGERDIIDLSTGRPVEQQ